MAQIYSFTIARSEPKTDGHFISDLTLLRVSAEFRHCCYVISPNLVDTAKDQWSLALRVTTGLLQCQQ